MAQRTVNQRQLDVLNWIAEGCPPDRWAVGDVTYKTTAVALQGRRLVTVSKKKGIWSATVTAAGQHFIKHGAYPEGHWAPAPPKPAPGFTPPARPAKQPQRKVTGLRPMEQFLADFEAAGWTLDYEDDGDNYFENLANTANRRGRFPDDKLLKITRGRGWGKKTIALVDKPEWMTVVLDPIPVAQTLTKIHPAVAALRTDKEDHLRFKRPVRQRALLLLNALAREATRRGYAVSAPSQRRAYYDRRDTWDLRIAIGEHHSDILVTDETDKVPHEPTAKELKDAEGPWGRRIPKYDHIASGRLTFTVVGAAVRQQAFGDTKTLNLDDRLANVLQEVELRAARDEEARLAREREAAERQARWEAVRDQAILDHAEQYKADVLAARAKRWREHRELTDYLTALTSQLDRLTAEQRVEADEWAHWATERLADTNPFGPKAFKAPDVPAPRPEDLKPFMRGLSPHGPNGW